jgi:hypothetical protein
MGASQRFQSRAHRLAVGHRPPRLWLIAQVMARPPIAATSSSQTPSLSEAEVLDRLALEADELDRPMGTLDHELEELAK